MVFSSIEFLWFFMPVVLALYLALPPRARNALLVRRQPRLLRLGRAVRWSCCSWRSIALNYARRAAHRARAGARGAPAGLARRSLVAVGLNLACLLFWKYAVFAPTSVGVAGRRSPAGSRRHAAHPLPLGISFFTFHGISYVVDVHRGTARPMRRVTDFGQYMAFFPQLIAGPIVRYHEIDEQIRKPPPRSQRLDDFADGLPALRARPQQEGAHRRPGRARSPPRRSTAAGTRASRWPGSASLAYTLQIYFDFSGYSDMAIGLARMFGFRFPENFDRPVLARCRSPTSGGAGT